MSVKKIEFITIMFLVALLILPEKISERFEMLETTGDSIYQGNYEKETAWEKEADGEIKTDSVEQVESVTDDKHKEKEGISEVEGETETMLKEESEDTTEGLEDEDEIEIETEIENESESGTESETESDLESVTEGETESESESGTESESESGTESESESGTESESESDTENETESDLESDTENETESDLESDTENETESDSETVVYEKNDIELKDCGKVDRSKLKKFRDVLKERNKRSNAIIIDTDFASDADDVIAIRLALCLQDKGMLDVKGIALSTTYSRSPSAIHALCQYDGYQDIPVAMDTSGNGVQVSTKYVDKMYNWPKSRDDFEQPVQMYRRLLAQSEKKVNIIALGFLQNIAALMNSGPDVYSPLTGAELIMQKVDTLYVVGGSDSGVPSFNFYWSGSKVLDAARKVTASFPGKIVYLPTDLSEDTFCGQIYGNKDKKSKDIVTEALKANSQELGVVAWDVFSVWCAAQDIQDTLEQYELSLVAGNWYISNTGGTVWEPDSSQLRYKMTKGRDGGSYNGYMNSLLNQKYNVTTAPKY